MSIRPSATARKTALEQGRGREHREAKDRSPTTWWRLWLPRPGPKRRAKAEHSWPMDPMVRGVSPSHRAAVPEEALHQEPRDEDTSAVGGRRLEATCRYEKPEGWAARNGQHRL